MRTGAFFIALCFSFFVPRVALASADDAVRWLREYIQIDTTNPPGNEGEAVAYLEGLLATGGIESQRLVSPEGRVSLYARLVSPRSGGRALALVHHIDVVSAGDGWRFEPFSGRLAEGRIWGRGALDVKGLGIAQLAVLLRLKESEASLGHDLIFLAVADEEAGGGQGAGWLLGAHADLFAGLEAVLNEGGGNQVVGGRMVWWGVEVAQKRPLWLRLTTRGRGGHASGFNPGSATHQLVIALARLAERAPRYRVTEPVRRYFQALAALEGSPKGHLAYRLDEVIAPEGPRETLPPGLPGLFVDSIQITEIRNGRGSNVVAPEAVAHVDIRLLPDANNEIFLASIRHTLGSQVEVEVLLSSPPAEPSPTDHPVFRALEKALEVRAPVVPTFISGVTDSRYFRERGIPAYGFSPFALEAQDQRGIHARDERLPVDAFLRGIEILERVIKACAEAP